MREGEVGLLEGADNPEASPPPLHLGHLLESRLHTGQAGHQVALALPIEEKSQEIFSFIQVPAAKPLVKARNVTARLGQIV